MGLSPRMAVMLLITLLSMPMPTLMMMMMLRKTTCLAR
jgi:hypothetical protein